MDCKNIEHLLSAYADDELAQTQREFVETHLKTCVECQVRFAEQKRISRRLAALRELPAVPDIKTKTMARIKGDVEPQKPRRSWRLALAAVPVTLMLVIALIMNLPGGSRMITAEELVEALLKNSSAITSFRNEGTFTLVSTLPGDESPSVLEVSITTIMDLASQRSYVDQTVTQSKIIGGVNTPDGNPERAETYYIDRWGYKIYRSLGPHQNPALKTGVWYKGELPENLWAAQFHTLHDDRESLISWLYYNPIVTILGTEMQDGIECYKVSILPDLENVSAAYFPAQQSVYDEFSLTGWVAVDSLELVKSDLSYRLISKGGLVTETTAVNHYSNINTATVELPTAALDAIPTPSSIPNENQGVPGLSGGIVQFANGLNSLRGDFIATITINGAGQSSSTLTTGTFLVDRFNKRFYFDQTTTKTGSTERMQQFWTSDYFYEWFGIGRLTRQPGVWYRVPVLPSNSEPLYSTVYHSTADLLLTSKVEMLGMEKIGGTDYFKLSVTNGYSLFMPGDVEPPTNSNFIAWVSTKDSSILKISVEIRSENGGVLTTLSQEISFSNFNAVTVEVPPEALNAPPPPVPPPPTTPPAP